MALNAGSAFVSLFGKFDHRDFEKFDRAVVAAQKRKAVQTELRGDFDARAFTRYEQEVKKSRELSERRSKLKTILGADFNPRAFNQYNRSLEESTRRSERLGRAHQRLTEHLKRAAGAALAAGSAYAGLRAAEGAIEVTDDLAKSTLRLQRSFGLTEKAAASWSSVAKSRDIDPTALTMGFTSLSRAVEAASLQFKKQGINTADFGRKQADLRKQIDALGSSQADQAQKSVLLARLQENETRAREKLTLGAGKQANAFAALGLTQGDLARSQHDFSFLVDRVTTGFEKLHGGTQRAALAQALFGRGARSLVPLLKGGELGFRGQAATAEKYGAVLGGKTLKSMEDLLKAQREARFATLGLQIAFATKLAPTLTEAITFVNQVVLALRGGKGESDKFSKSVNTTAGVLRSFGDAAKVSWKGLTVMSGLVKKALDGWGGFFSTLIRGEGVLAGFLGMLHPGNDAFDRFSKRAGEAADRIDKWREKLRPAAKNVEDLTHHTTEASSGFQKFRERVGDAGTATGALRAMIELLDRGVDVHTRNIQSNVAKRLARAASEGAGKFSDLRVAVGRSLTGINSMLTRELKTLGSALKIDASFSSRAPGAGHARGGRIGRARGGWVGGRGQISDDVVPLEPGILVGLGEYDAVGPGDQRAILNRYQQPYVEAALSAGGYPNLDALPAGQQLPIIERAMAIFGGLDRLFAIVNRPHYLAGGGRFATGGIAGMYAAANRLEAAHFPYRWGGGHQASPAPFGPMDCSGAVSFVLQHGGVDIPTMVSGQLAGAGSPGPGAVTVFANPTHTFMRLPNGAFFGTSGSNPGGGAGYFPNPGSSYMHRFTQRHFAAGMTSFPSINVSVTGAGMMPAIVRAAAGLSARAANRFLRSRIENIGVGTGDVGDAGPGIRGRVSTFGPPTEPARQTASGVSSSLPGIALFNRSTLGKNFELTIGSHSGILRQTDIGPAPFTGRVIDVTGAGASRIGINPRRFPTDSIGTATPAFGMGGWLGLASGGRRRKRKGHAIHELRPIGENRGILRSIARGEAGVKTFEDLIQRRERRYDQTDRLYGLSEEVLLIENDDGSATVDTDAVAKRTRELEVLIQMREEIRAKIIEYRRVVRELIRMYRDMIKRVTAALKAAKGQARAKTRQKYREEIEGYNTRIGELRSVYQDLGGDITDQDIDLLELSRELGEVQNTTGRPPTPAEVQEPESPPDQGPTPEEQAAQQAAADEAARVQRQLEIVTENLRVTTGYFNAFTSSTASGATAFAATGATQAAGGPMALVEPTRPGTFEQTININTLHPGDPATLRAVGDAAVGGIGLQPTRQSSTRNLGL